jgi:hypothetical protein
MPWLLLDERHEFEQTRGLDDAGLEKQLLVGEPLPLLPEESIPDDERLDVCRYGLKHDSTTSECVPRPGAPLLARRHDDSVAKLWRPSAGRLHDGFVSKTVASAPAATISWRFTLPRVARPRQASMH